MTQILVEREINLREYPLIDKILSGKRGRLVAGDMHGNALKMINFLIQQGVMELGKNEFDQFLKIHDKKAEEITKDDLKQFNEILDKATYHSVSALTFIGDLFGDRVSNDYFSLKIFGKLHQNKIPYQIIFSNHDMEFIKAYESSPPNFTPSMLEGGHAASLYALKDLLDKGLVQVEEVMDLINQVYKPNLVAVGYTLDDKGITLYTHGDEDIEDIQYLAESLSIEFKDDTPHDLARTIDNINDYFKKNHVDKNEVHKLIPDDIAYMAYQGKSIDRKLYPFVNLIWSRDTSIKRAPTHKGYPIRYVHGHDYSDPSANNVVNLDHKNSAGKTKNSFVGSSSVLFTDEKTLAELASPESANSPLTTTVAVETIVVPELERTKTPTLEELGLQFPPLPPPAPLPSSPRYYAPAVPASKIKKPSLGEEMEKMQAKIYSTSIREVLKAPSRNPLLAGLVISALAFPVMAYFWGSMAIVYGIVSSVLVASAIAFRNDFYDDNAVCIKAEKEKGGQSYNSAVYEKGLAAGLSFTPYLKSYMDKEAWKDPFTFGAGMRQSLVDEKERNLLRK